MFAFVNTYPRNFITLYSLRSGPRTIERYADDIVMATHILIFGNIERKRNE